ncbi:hypothetical protein FB192DRAFT_1446970 [Mucor lusitanicus]|uniref:Uncharacterized protein n=2 Tax=Mucor circinelloides f. lusitanicus TaxID=29924 RepID=A0A162ZVJ0_MUCCL|nr:hypothetical protein FB192DRAFT_1446970 [Mucor lusitanicus]OAD08037.1 hypothetical protein MUCCIDRAFT_104987 [Mucor lusitanicus CBS 277.49]
MSGCARTQNSRFKIPIDPTTPHSNPLVTMLAIHVNNQNRSAYHQIPLLLPAAGRSFTKSRRTNTIDLIYHSIDMLPQDFDHATINHATGLTIPLQTIVYTPAASTFKFPTKFRSMIADDVFHLHPTHRFLHWKDPADSSLAPWNPAPSQPILGLERGAIRLQPFFIPLYIPAPTSTIVSTAISFRPLAYWLLLDMDLHNPLARCTSKTFLEACSLSIVPPTYLLDIAASA